MRNLFGSVKNLVKMGAVLVVLGLASEIVAADCEEWVAGAKIYSVGQTVTYNGQGYVCKNSASAWENPTNGTWFWNITDACDLPANNAPTDILLSNFSIDEDMASGITIGLLTATDPDSLDTHTFILKDSTAYPDNQSFYIDGNSLKSNDVFDFDTKNSYSITIKVVDSGSDSLSFEKAFTISVNQITNLLDWPYSEKIYFNTTASGALMTYSLMNFPVVINLNSSNYNFSQSTNSGSDIRFSDFSGNFLKYEIEKWDSANGLATVWVKVPSVKANSSSEYINIHWGNLTADFANDANALFSSSYLSVWHLSDSFEDTTITNYYKDAVGNFDGVDFVSSNDKNGIVANGQKFNGTSDYISVENFTSDSIGEIAISMWVTSTSNSTSTLISKCEGDYATGFGLSVTDSSKLKFTINSGTKQTLVTDSVFDLSAWTYLTAVFDDNNMRLLVNGEEVAFKSVANGKIINSNSSLNIARNSADSSEYFSGSIDELRVSLSYNGDSWNRLNYLNQRSTQNFVTVGEDTATVKAPINLSVTNNNNTLPSHRITKLLTMWLVKRHVLVCK